MKLKRIISLAKDRELKQVSTADKTDEVIISYINLAVLALYSKFQLDTRELIINVRTDKSDYVLDGTDVDVSMDADTEVLQLVEAYDEQGLIGINNEAARYSIYTISYDSVQVPGAVDGARIGIIYKPVPTDVEFIDAGEGVATEATIRLPAGLTTALLAHIGYSANVSIEDNAAYLAKYERACLEAIKNGVVPSDALNIDVIEKGWV